jgi:glycosyltransferase involved in cell wall biosynthesis
MIAGYQASRLCRPDEAMRIWLLNPYGPIPGEGWRSHRFTLIGSTLARRGHDVTWWTATFAHHFKHQRCTGWKDRIVEPGFRLRLIPTPSYTANVGFARLWFETVFVARTYQRSRREPPPELVLSIEPPQSVSYIASQIASSVGARLHIDVFDLWPELFETLFPRGARRVARVLLAPLRALRRRNLRRADVVTAVSDSYADVVRAAIGSCKAPVVETIHIGVRADEFLVPYAPEQPEQQVRARLGIGTEDLLAVYAGSLGARYDINVLIEAAALLCHNCAPVHIVIVGDGPFRGRVTTAAAMPGATNLHYLGVFDPRDLAPLYRAADVGLCTYSEDSTVTFPTKAFDYLAAGLPIVSSLNGEFKRTLLAYGAGVVYTAGSAASLADSLTRLAANRNSLVVLCAHARALGEQFDATRLYARFADLVGG